MRICIDRQQSPCHSTTSLPKAQIYPYSHSLSGSMKGNQFMLKSTQSNMYKCDPSVFSSFKQTPKISISDSILIEDKQNCYISNRPSNIPTSRTETLNRCENHQRDKAEYYLTSEGGQIFQYCNKCAASLIGQGFKVDRISQSISINKNTPLKHLSVEGRKEELDEIWELFQKIYEEALHKKNKTDNFIFSSQGFFNEQIQQINLYFQQLHNYLEVLKNRFYNNILHEKEVIIKTSQEWSRVLSQVLTQIESIECDIRINQENVLLVEESQYKDLVQALSGHLKEYFGITNNWRIQSLPAKRFVVPSVEEVQESIRNMLTSMCKTPRNSLMRDRTEAPKTMGKSNSCIFSATNNSILDLKYSIARREMQ